MKQAKIGVALHSGLMTVPVATLNEGQAIGFFMESCKVAKNAPPWDTSLRGVAGSVGENYTS